MRARVAYARRALVARANSNQSRLKSSSAPDGYLRQLLRNDELNEQEARNELRWIQDEVRISETHRTEAEVAERVGEVVKARSDGVPLQYALGNVDFGSLTLLCKPPTLIPRPETAHCFTQLARHIAESTPDASLDVVDLCTGSAPIPLLLKHILGNRVGSVMGVDNSSMALKLAQENINATGITGVSLWQESIFASSFTENLLARLGKDSRGAQRKVGLLTANPPYIPLAQYRALPRSVREFEDQAALLSGQDDEDGLRFYRRIADLLPAVLEPTREGPRVAVEVGEGQAGDVATLFKEQGMSKVEAWKDQWGVERMVVGWTS